MKEFVEKLIERLEEERHPEILGGWPSIRIERAIKIINQLAEEYTQDSTKNNQGWILCSERLPENYETVNITWINKKPVPYYEHIKDKPFMGTAIFHYGKWYWYSCVCEDYLRECGDSTCDRMDKDIEVIAWQPLPEPYKEPQKEIPTNHYTERFNRVM